MTRSRISWATRVMARWMSCAFIVDCGMAFPEKRGRAAVQGKKNPHQGKGAPSEDAVVRVGMVSWSFS